MSWLSSIVGAVGSGLASSKIPLISGVGGALSSIGATVQHKEDKNWSAEEAQKNRDFQTSERLAVQDYNTNFWHMNNEYNSPSAQLQRLMDAGINPNAMFQGSGYNSVSSSPMSSTAMSGNVASSPNGFASAKLTADAQIANLMASTRKMDTESNLNDYQLDFFKLTESQRIEALERGNELLGAQSNFYKVDADIKQKMYNWYALMSEEDIKLKKEQLNLLRNQSLEILYSIDESKSRVRLNDSQVRVNNAQVDYIEANTEKVGVETDLLYIEKQFSELSGVPLGSSEFEVMFNLWRKGELWSSMELAAAKGAYAFAENLGSGAAQSITKIPNQIIDIIGSIFKPLGGLFRAFGKSNSKTK